jgi:hypothetical protein
MYSRSDRKFQTPNKDHLNPNLGPGCYTLDQKQELVRPSAYAPFSSLAPRVSFFEELVKSGPAPGSYDGIMGLDSVCNSGLT